MHERVDTRPGTAGGSPPRIAFVQSEWHEDIVDRCRDAFLAEITRLGVDAGEVDLFRVPGAFEIPLHAQRLAASGRYAAVVGAGLVVDGGIYRHEFVADAVVTGSCGSSSTPTSRSCRPCSPRTTSTSTPCTTAFFAEHLAVKGAEAARACARTADQPRRDCPAGPPDRPASARRRHGVSAGPAPRRPRPGRPRTGARPAPGCRRRWPRSGPILVAALRRTSRARRGRPRPRRGRRPARPCGPRPATARHIGPRASPRPSHRWNSA